MKLHSKLQNFSSRPLTRSENAPSPRTSWMRSDIASALSMRFRVSVLAFPACSGVKGLVIRVYGKPETCTCQNPFEEPNLTHETLSKVLEHQGDSQRHTCVNVLFRSQFDSRDPQEGAQSASGEPET